MDASRTAVARAVSRRISTVASLLVIIGCATGTAQVGSPAPPSIAGAWRPLEHASRPSGGAGEWQVRSVPQGGLYVFSERHYSYFYVTGDTPRTRFADGNRPTDAERAATFSTFIAGAGQYSFDGRTMRLRSDFRKNPNEMTGEFWIWELDVVRGDTIQFIFREPPFLPGRDWRTTLVRAR